MEIKALDISIQKLDSPQGAVSSTTLFNIYISNLPESIKSLKGINIGMFADNMIIWTTDKTTPTSRNQK